MTGYLVLVAGLLLWSGPHLWKRLAPASRAAKGEPGKGIVALLSLLGIVAMVIGYRWAPVDPLWPLVGGLKHLNNLLVLLAFYLFAASGMKTVATRYVRHPQLWGVRLWALAHLLVNGDVASVILFGGLFAWAQAEAHLINRDVPVWDKPSGPVNLGKEFGAAIGAILLVGVVGMIHTWLGYNPFG